MSIPKRISQIWVGNKPAPMKLINQWKDMYESAGWEYKLWTNDHLRSTAYRELFYPLNYKIFQLMEREPNGAADCMRWCICRSHGGWVVDADAIPVDVFPDGWNQNKAVAFWENEICRPGLVAAGYFGCETGSPLVNDIVDRIIKTDVMSKMAWETVGPVPLTEESHGHPELVVLPSRHVIPEHFSGCLAPGNHKIYASQLWGSTKGYSIEWQ